MWDNGNIGSSIVVCGTMEILVAVLWYVGQWKYW